MSDEITCTCGASGALDGHDYNCALRTGRMPDMGDAIEHVAREGGPESAALLTRLMEHSARERESIERSLAEGMERERDEWRERCFQAEAELAAIRDGFDRLLYPRPEQVECFKTVIIQRVR